MIINSKRNKKKDVNRNHSSPETITSLDFNLVKTYKATESSKNQNKHIIIQIT